MRNRIHLKRRRGPTISPCGGGGHDAATIVRKLATTTVRWRWARGGRATGWFRWCIGVGHGGVTSARQRDDDDDGGGGKT